MTSQQDPPGGPNRLWQGVRSWVVALLVAGPLYIGLWFFTDVPREPWFDPALRLGVVALLLAIGWASRSSLWELVVWLGPLIVVLAIGWAAPSYGVAVLTAVVVLWTTGLMLSGSISQRIFGWANRLFVCVVDASLPAQHRAAYRAFRDTLKRNLQLRGDQEQLEDRPRMVRAFREAGARFDALVAPDSRWKEVFDSFGLSAVRYADMLEGREPMDYDELKRLFAMREPLLRQLLSDESTAYRILTYVPRH